MEEHNNVSILLGFRRSRLLASHCFTFAVQALFKFDVDLRVVGIDGTGQPEFVNDAWKIQHIEDEQQRA